MTIPEIQKRISELSREQKDSQQIAHDLNNRLQDIREDLKNLRALLAALQPNMKKPNNLHISDHAILRYLERHKNVCIEDVKDEIQEKLHGAADLKTVNALGFVIKDKVVITYLPEGQSK